MTEDPFLWLEDLEGERALAWAREQNARTLGELQGDARFARFETEARNILEARDRIADPVPMGGHIYNFWQDDVQVRGLLRRTDWTSYLAGTPDWESVLDVDALAAKDGKPWVTGMPDCLAPEYRRCLVRLSNGGKDAAIVREFDLEAKAFVDGGFELPEAKSGLGCADQDTLLGATNWTACTLTTSVTRADVSARARLTWSARVSTGVATKVTSASWTSPVPAVNPRASAVAQRVGS